MSVRELTEWAGISYGYMPRAFRGCHNIGVKVRAGVESALRAPARV